MKARVLRKKISTHMTGYCNRQRRYSPQHRSLVQTALKVSEPGDRYEQQADRIADQVLQAKPIESIQGLAQTHPQPMCEDCQQEDDEMAQAKTKEPPNQTNSSPPLPANSGQPLPTSVKQFMKSRFHAPFDDVRIHTGQAASQSAQSIGAYAYALGNHIVFDQHHYQPETKQVKHLLAHELPHVLQQRKTNQSMLEGTWIIDNPNQVQVSGGETNETLLEDAFQNICSLAGVSNQGSNRIIKTNSGLPSSGSAVGCNRLRIIENDAALLQAGTPDFLRVIPNINIAVNSWSFTKSNPSNPMVSVRHPEDPFQWGYWTGGGISANKKNFLEH